ncbi:MULTISPECIES: dipeptidase [unclassified Sphingomonas]|uniref:dipeptidase n=1 Tax=Sphingomonas TaxID=13687 RepID=UPI0009698996|nr:MULTISPECIES: dipeptidase [unclassified Sphingomonas]MBN8813721.1 dipeptidase [Sphingomonas sp.]OJY51908.1 MAG: peptidase M19 [Sphingomonas sp. 67-41]
MISLLALAIALSGPDSDTPTPADRLAHDQMLVLDTHLDTPELFEHPGWKFDRWHDRDFDKSQVDLPRMEQGGLDGGFFVIYTGQGPLTPEGYAKARNAALTREMWIQRVVAANADKMEFATTPEDAHRIAKAGKRIVFQSIENSYPLGTDLSLLKWYYDQGVRMAGPIHFRNNQFGDSATDKVKQWNGLSPLGKQWVAEMNRLGMLIDVSHSSDDVFDQALALSKVPIIASHSGPRAIFNHPRNLDDERMRKLAKAGGVLQVNSVYLVEGDHDEARNKISDRQDDWWALSAADQRQLIADKAKADATNPYQGADFELFMKSLLHCIAVMGVDHVGIGADWDGGGGVRGMEDITALPKITARLRREGFSDTDIEKIWSGNVLRVLKQAEDWAAKNK